MNNDCLPAHNLPLQYPALLCCYLALYWSAFMQTPQSLGVKGHVQFNRNILYIDSNLTCNKGVSSEV